jgi:predicted amidohydrolase
MKNNARVAVVQCQPIWNNKAANISLLKELLLPVVADVIVLPELALTGYSFLTAEEALATADDAATAAAYLQPFANDKNAVVVMGFAEKHNGKVYNSAIVVLPHQPFVVYRKTHLFYKEKVVFTEGDTGFITLKHPAIDCYIGIMVCYDWRFPESARTLALQGADIIVVPANLVTQVWETGMKARALENNVYVAVANRYGTETRTQENGEIQQLSFTGKSVIYGIDGTAITQATANNTAILYATIDIATSRQKNFNEFNNIFLDRRPALYKLS